VHGADLAARHQKLRERLQAGDFARAEVMGISILKQHSKDTETLHLLGIIAMQKKDVKKAAQRFRQAIAVNPHEAVYHSNLGEVLRLSQQPEEGAASCRKAIELQPQYPAAYGNLGACLYALKDFTGAQQAYETALQLLPDNSALTAFRADALREQGKIKEAVEGYEAALALDDSNPHAQGNLGVLSLEIGKARFALEHCQKAVELDPQSGHPHLNLGKCLHSLGRIEEAMDAYATAYEKLPGSSTLCANIADIWQEVADLEQAKRWFEQSLECDPKEVRARIGLAEIQTERDDLESAIQALTTIVEEYPQQVPAHVALARAKWDDGDAEGSIEAYRRALELHPEHASLYSSLGRVLASSGDTKTAAIQQREALKRNPRCIPALSELAVNLRKEITDEELKTMRELLEDTNLNDGPRASLHFGLAHYHDSKKEFDLAGEHGVLGNQYQWAFKSKRGWDYEADKYRQFVDNLIQTFDADYFQRVAGLGHDSTIPVFVLGMPRSGTTLTEQILASHPRVFGVGERNFASRSYALFPHVAGDLTKSPLENLAALKPGMLPPLAEQYLERLHALARKAGRTPESVDRIVDKMPDNYSLLGWILTLFPNAKILHTRRDVRDVAVSCWITNFGAIQWASRIHDLAERIVQYDRIMKHWRTVVPDRILELDYEKTVADQEGESRRMVDWIGMPWDDACLNFHQSERLVRTASVTQVRQPIYKRSVERWRSYEKPLKELFDRLEDAGVVPPRNG
jgi:tetratricopeptide (TPR) repeat protein